MITRTFANRPTASRRGEDPEYHHHAADVEFARRGAWDPWDDSKKKKKKDDDDDDDDDENKAEKGNRSGGRRSRGWGRFFYYNNTLAGQYSRKLPTVSVFVVTGTLFLVVLPCLVVWLASSPSVMDLSELPVVDFVVGGFPKCGTTTLLYALRQHEEIEMPSRESCALKDTWRATYHIWQRYQTEVKELTTTTTNNQTGSSQKWREATSMRRISGIKCPTAIYSHEMMERLNEINQHHHDNNNNNNSPLPVKWIIGIRHPIWQVQSFYNYRITELYDKKKWWKGIRTLDNIMFSDTPWKDISSDSHHYQNYLGTLLSFLKHAQLNAAKADRGKLGPTVFLYTMEQLEDDDEIRAMNFRRDLSSFLGLRTTLPEFGKENINRFVSGPHKHPEIISICDDQFQKVRQKLVVDSAATSNWIQQNLLLHPHKHPSAGILDVGSHLMISNSSFVYDILESWKHDPCNSLMDG